MAGTLISFANMMNYYLIQTYHNMFRKNSNIRKNLLWIDGFKYSNIWNNHPSPVLVTDSGVARKSAFPLQDYRCRVFSRNFCSIFANASKKVFGVEHETPSWLRGPNSSSSPRLRYYGGFYANGYRSNVRS